MLSSPTLAQRLADTRSNSSGFDYLRLALAAAVVCYHSAVTTGGEALQRQISDSWVGHVFALVLPMFFALSGFLVAGSLLRSQTLAEFLGLRALRIFPALILNTLACALLLGPLMSTLGIGPYFADPLFWRYLWNALGHPQFHLPGVFADSPTSEVNSQLWTIPVELECYIVLATLALLRLPRLRRLYAALFVAALLALEAQAWNGAGPWLGRQLILSFHAGVLLFLLRDRVRWSSLAGAAALALALAALSRPATAYLAAPPAAYLAVWIGLHDGRRAALLRSGDYSYGLYLGGFPIQQLLVATLPAARVWWINLLLGLLFGLAFAAVSWHAVEKPALARKRHLRAAIDALRRGRPAAATGAALCSRADHEDQLRPTESHQPARAQRAGSVPASVSRPHRAGADVSGARGGDHAGAAGSAEVAD